MSNLYETDHHKWLSEQAALLANKQFDQLDLDNLLEELELSIKQDLRELEGHLANLILHLLKMDYQTSVLRDSVATERVIKGWVVSVWNARDGVNKLIEKNHCLTSRIKAALVESYAYGKKKAIREMNMYINANQRLNENSFPDQCPWSYEQMMTEDWYPLNGVNPYE